MSNEDIGTRVARLLSGLGDNERDIYASLSAHDIRPIQHGKCDDEWPRSLGRFLAIHGIDSSGVFVGRLSPIGDVDPVANYLTANRSLTADRTERGPKVFQIRRRHAKLGDSSRLCDIYLDAYGEHHPELLPLYELLVGLYGDKLWS